MHCIARCRKKNWKNYPDNNITDKYSCIALYYIMMLLQGLTNTFVEYQHWKYSGIAYYGQILSNINTLITQNYFLQANTDTYHCQISQHWMLRENVKCKRYHCEITLLSNILALKLARKNWHESLSNINGLWYPQTVGCMHTDKYYCKKFTKSNIPALHSVGTHWLLSLSNINTLKCQHCGKHWPIFFLNNSYFLTILALSACGKH